MNKDQILLGWNAVGRERPGKARIIPKAQLWLGKGCSSALEQEPSPGSTFGVSPVGFGEEGEKPTMEWEGWERNCQRRVPG